MKLKSSTVLLTIIGVFTFVGLLELTNEYSVVYFNTDGETKYEIRTNERGQTYGSNLATTEYGGEPDLIKVESEDGKTGYVYKEDFYDTSNQPSNPEEALEYMKNLNKTKYRVIPMYDENGVSVIDTFKIWNK